MVGDEQHGAGAPRHRAARAPRPSRGLSRAAARWFTDGPLARPGARRRYLTVALVFAVLCALPGIIAAWPASAQSVSAAEMLSRIKASASIPYSGLASASGNLALPDLPLGNQVTNLLSSTTRVRAWWLSPNRYRVDQQTPDGEYDTYRNGRVTWSWDSSSRSASRSRGAPEFGPFPSGVDVLPGPLARRVLSQAPVSQLTVGGSHRVSGHTTRLLTWRPNDPHSLVGEVRIWADPANGFVYGVEIRAVGGQVRAFSTSFLDVSLDAPPRSRTNFDPGKDPSSFVSDDRGDRSPLFGFADLPKELGGLPLRSPMGTLFGTYGKGASLVALAVFPDGGNGAGAIDTLRNSIDSPGRPPIEGAFGKGSLISTPLLTGLVFADGNQGYVLVGTVTRAQLEAMALDLVKNPPVTLGGVSEGFGS